MDPTRKEEEKKTKKRRGRKLKAPAAKKKKSEKVVCPPSNSDDECSGSDFDVCDIECEEIDVTDSDLDSEDDDDDDNETEINENIDEDQVLEDAAADIAMSVEFANIVLKKIKEEFPAITCTYVQFSVHSVSPISNYVNDLDGNEKAKRQKTKK